MARMAGFHHPERPDRRLRGDDGTAVVEFALVLPFLAVLALGTVDLGRAFQMKNRLTNAAREGAIYGQFHPCETADINTAVANEDPKVSTLTGYSVTTTISGIACGQTGGPTGNLTVKASATLRLLTPFIGAITGQNVTVSGSSTVVVQ